MSSYIKTRLPPLILLGVIILAVTVAVVVLGQNRYFSDAKTLQDAFRGDQLIMSQIPGFDFSTFWCSAYNVNPWDYADVYLLPKMPEISSEHRVTKIEILRSMAAMNSYDERGAYLLKGSQISFKACRELNTTVLTEVMIVKGMSVWDRWSSNQYTCSDCAIVNEDIPLGAICALSGKVDILNYIVTNEDFYHIVISRKYESDLEKAVYLSYDIILNRTSYDISSHISMCNHTSETCALELSHDSPEQILIDFEENERLGGEVRFQHKCDPAIVVWFGIFGILPFGLIIILLVYLKCVWTRNGSNK
ncbi:hypothetical protein SNE40_019138 [Patella caerulea]|uniref:E3 ubiquitin-protein ligase APD1-4 middle domain-containing protein n=1 Tax=Patella caerulea TaxID=87958 RepID=A0AAN8J9D0_PATCE